MSWQCLHPSIQFLRKRSESRRAYHGEPLFEPTNSTLHVLVTQARTLFETQRRPSRTQTDGCMHVRTYVHTSHTYLLQPNCSQAMYILEPVMCTYIEPSRCHRNCPSGLGVWPIPHIFSDIPGSGRVDTP